MLKIEKWRIEELALVLSDIVASLHQGENREWANVFVHFLSEAERIHLKDRVYIDEFKRLVHNILCCYLEGDSFRRMILFPGNSEESLTRNKQFHHLQARLYHLLTDLQTRFVVFVH
ncbi:MAG: hypothetical protein ACERK6_04210 [Candidatus Aminicenantaceae bacterium]